jgi:type II secretory pathway component PulF
MAGRTPKLDDQACSIFLGGIASALRAGHEPKVALELLAQDDLDPRLASAAQTLAARSAGKSLSDSMASMPRTFAPAIVAAVREGESAGRAADYLDLVAADRARSADFGPRLALALFFPLLALGVAFLVLLLLAVFVMPAFRSVFVSFGADLPALTLFYIGIADFIESYWLFLVAAFIAIFLAFSLRSRFDMGSTSTRCCCARRSSPGSCGAPTARASPGCSPMRRGWESTPAPRSPICATPRGTACSPSARKPWAAKPQPLRTWDRGSRVPDPSRGA